MMNFMRRFISCFIGIGLAAVCVEPLMATTWQRITGEGYPVGGVPGQPAAEHFILQAPVLNDAGQVAYSSVLSAFSVNDNDTETIWAGPAGQPELVVREGDAAPGTSEEFDSLLVDPLLNDAGQVLINANVTGSLAQRNGLWVGTPDNLQLLVRTNTPISGLSSAINDISERSVQFSDSGKATFLATDTTGKSGVWYGSTGSVQVAARQGDFVPASSGLSSGVKFQSFIPPLNSPAINPAGQVVFKAGLAGSNVNGDSIWIGTPGDLRLVARVDTPAPGSPGVEFFGLNTYPVINGSGQVAFGASLTNFRDSIWLGTPGNLQMILEGNDPAPVGTSGVRFSDFGTYKELRLSDSGHVGFEAWLEGTGVGFNNDHGLFRASAGGASMVARKGKQAPGMEAGAVFEFFEDYSINTAGQMAFMGTTTGGSASASQGRGIWAQNPSGGLELVVRVGDWAHPTTGDVVRLIDATNPALLESQGYGQVFLLDWQSAFGLSAEQGTAWNANHQIAFSVTFANLDFGRVLFVADLGGLSGDFDNDGQVDGRDFLVWQRTDRTSAGLTAWQQGYGQSSGLKGIAAVPEPATVLLLVAGAMGILHHRYFVR